MESAEKRTAEDLCPFTPSPLSKSAKKKAKKELFGEHAVPMLEASAAEGPVLATIIYEMRGTLRELSLDVKAIRGDMDSFQRKLSNVEAEVSAMNASLMSLNKRTDIMQAAQREDRLHIREATSTIAKLQSSVAELEDRNRRNNLRLVNLPENEEGGDTIAFLQRQLPIWFPSLANRGIIEIERAHRVYSKGENSSSKPRTLIFKLLRYNDRQAIMKAYRQAGTKVQHGQSQLMLFADYSNATVLKRKAFSSCIASLKQKGIQFFLLYPASLKVTVDSNNTRIFSSPEEAQHYIKDI